MNTPKKMIALLSGAALLSAGSLFAGNVVPSVATDPVGYVTLDVKGTGGAEAVYSFVSVSLQHAADFNGAVSSFGANSLTVDDAGWEVDGFAGSHYVQVSNGYVASILSNTATVLATVEDLSSLLSGGESIVIRKYTTIADVFGANNESGLLASGSLAGADEIMIADGSGGFDRYFYLESARLADGWRLSSDLVTDASDVPVPLGQGLVIRSKSVDANEIVISGSVVTNDSSIYPLEVGYNFVSAAYPVEYTLATFFGVDGGSLTSASSFADADQVLVQREDGAFDYYFYMDSPRLGEGWRKSDDLVNDAANVIVSAGSSAIVVKRAGVALNFVEAKPF